MSPGDWVIAALFAGILIVVTAQVASRYVFRDPLDWTEELARYLFTWMIFIGAALAVKEATHIRVRVLDELLPPRWAKYLRLGQLGVAVVFLAYAVVVGIQYVLDNPNTPSPMLRLPLNLVLYASLPVGSALGLYFAVRRLFRAILAPEGGGPQQEES
jgi:TRAP-type C4-dicarboxylate transport system permease small subunit